MNLFNPIKLDLSPVAVLCAHDSDFREALRVQLNKLPADELDGAAHALVAERLRATGTRP